VPRSVVLDIGGVLELTPPTGWLARWEQDAGLTQGAVHDVLGDVFAAGSVGTITEAEVIAAAHARLAVPPAMLDRFWADMWDEYLGTLNADLYDWFRALRPARRTGILSNSFVGAREREHERYGFADIVDVLVYSHEVGLAKPDPAVFALTSERLGVPPGDVVFLDDTPRMVEAARQAGWHAVEFQDTRQAIAEVEALLA
jgi:HAD superfamily hydrolase (TIGR01509 family)